MAVERRKTKKEAPERREVPEVEEVGVPRTREWDGTREKEGPVAPVLVPDEAAVVVAPRKTWSFRHTWFGPVHCSNNPCDCTDAPTAGWAVVPVRVREGPGSAPGKWTV